jgi:hypothetical protein
VWQIQHWMSKVIYSSADESSLCVRGRELAAIGFQTDLQGYPLDSVTIYLQADPGMGVNNLSASQVYVARFVCEESEISVSCSNDHRHTDS